MRIELFMKGEMHIRSNFHFSLLLPSGYEAYQIKGSCQLLARILKHQTALEYFDVVSCNQVVYTNEKSGLILSQKKRETLDLFMEAGGFEMSLSPKNMYICVM